MMNVITMSLDDELRGLAALHQMIECVGMPGIADKHVAKICVENEKSLRKLMLYILEAFAEDFNIEDEDVQI